MRMQGSAVGADEGPAEVELASPHPRDPSPHKALLRKSSNVFAGRQLRVDTLRHRLAREQEIRQGYWKLLVWTSFLLVLYCVVALQSRVTVIFPTSTAARTALNGHANADKFTQISRADDYYNWLRDVFVPQLFEEDSALVGRCVHSPEFVPTDQICDGVMDCADGSDEVACETRSCAPPFDQCTDALVEVAEAEEETTAVGAILSEFTDDECAGTELSRSTLSADTCFPTSAGQSFQVRDCELFQFATPNCTGTATKLPLPDRACNGQGKLFRCDTNSLRSFRLEFGEFDPSSCAPVPGSSTTFTINHHTSLSPDHYSSVAYQCTVTDDGDFSTEFECSPNFQTTIERTDLAELADLPSQYTVSIVAYDSQQSIASAEEIIDATTLRKCVFESEPLLANCTVAEGDWHKLGDGICDCQYGLDACALDLGDCSVGECDAARKKEAGGHGRVGPWAGIVREAPSFSKEARLDEQQAQEQAPDAAVPGWGVAPGTRNNAEEKDEPVQALYDVYNAETVEAWTIFNSSCDNTADWVGQDSSTCLDYDMDPSLCTDTEFWDAMAALGHPTPHEACCACGGGSPVGEFCGWLNFFSPLGATFFIVEGRGLNPLVTVPDESCHAGALAVMLIARTGASWAGTTLNIFDCEGNPLKAGLTTSAVSEHVACVEDAPMILQVSEPLSRIEWRLVKWEDLEAGNLAWTTISTSEQTVWGYECGHIEWTHTQLQDIAKENPPDTRICVPPSPTYRIGVCSEKDSSWSFRSDEGAMLTGTSNCDIQTLDRFPSKPRSLAFGQTDLSMNELLLSPPEAVVIVDGVALFSQAMENLEPLALNPNFRTFGVLTRPREMPRAIDLYFRAFYSPAEDVDTFSPFQMVTGAGWICFVPVHDDFAQIGFNTTDGFETLMPPSLGSEKIFPPNTMRLTASSVWLTTALGCSFDHQNRIAVAAVVELSMDGATADLSDPDTVAESLAPALAAVAGVDAVSTTVTLALATANDKQGAVDATATALFDVTTSREGALVSRSVQKASAEAWASAAQSVVGGTVQASAATVLFVGDPALQGTTVSLTCAAPASVSVVGFNMRVPMQLVVTPVAGGDQTPQTVVVRVCAPSLEDDTEVRFYLREGDVSGSKMEGKGLLRLQLTPGTYELQIATDAPTEVTLVAECSAHVKVVQAVVSWDPSAAAVMTTASVRLCLAPAIPHAWDCPDADLLVVVLGDGAAFVEARTTPELVEGVRSGLAALGQFECSGFDAVLNVTEVRAEEKGVTDILEENFNIMLEYVSAHPASSSLWTCATPECERRCNAGTADCVEGYQESTGCSCFWRCSVCGFVNVKVTTGDNPSTMFWRLGTNEEVGPYELAHSQYEHRVRICPGSGSHLLTMRASKGLGWGDDSQLWISDEDGNVLFSAPPFTASREVAHVVEIDLPFPSYSSFEDTEGCGVILVRTYADTPTTISVDESPEHLIDGVGLVGIVAGRGCHLVRSDTSERLLQVEDFSLLGLGLAETHTLREDSSGYDLVFVLQGSNSAYRGDSTECVPCSSGNIHPQQLCNGMDDCDEADDESMCFYCGYEERSGQFTSPDNRCSGVAECLDGSDEFYCFACGDGEHVPVSSPLNPDLPSYRCDGTAQCSSGKDEEMCAFHVGRCLPDSMVCDFSTDCLVEGADTNGNLTVSVDEAACSSCGSYYEEKIAQHLSVIGYAWLGVSVREFKPCPGGTFSDFDATCISRRLITDDSQVLCVGVCNTQGNASDSQCIERATTLLSIEEANENEVCQQRPGAVNFNRWEWRPEGSAYMTPLVDRRMYKAQEAVEWWRRAGLINELTAQVKVILPLFDATNGIFVIATMGLDIGVEGLIVSSIDTTAVDGEQYNFNDTTDVVRFVLELVLVVAAMMDLASELIQIAHYWKHPDLSISDYFHDFYNVLDWMFYSSFLVCVVLWLRVVNSTSSVRIPCGDDAGSYIKLVGDLLALDSAVAAYQTALAVLMMAVMLKTFKYFDFQHRLSVLNKTLGFAMGNLGPFVFLLVYVFVGFSLLSHFTFGDTLADYSNPWISFLSLFGFMMNDSWYVVNMYQASDWVGAVIFIAYAVLVMISLFNMSVAIVIEAFVNSSNDCEQEGDDSSITREVARSLRYVWERLKVLTNAHQSCMDEPRLRKNLERLENDQQELHTHQDLVRLWDYSDKQASKILERFGEEDDMTQLFKESEEMGNDNKRLANRIAVEMENTLGELKSKIKKGQKKEETYVQDLRAEFDAALKDVEGKLSRLLAMRSERN